MHPALGGRPARTARGMGSPAPPGSRAGATAQGHASTTALPGVPVARAETIAMTATEHEHQPFSITAQQIALTRYVSTQPGWTLVGEFSDDASGATTSRPGLQAALRAARDERYDTLLVYRVDRFSRRLSDLLDLLTEL